MGDLQFFKSSCWLLLLLFLKKTNAETENELFGKAKVLASDWWGQCKLLSLASSLQKIANTV